MPAAVSLRWVVGGGEPRSTRDQQGRHPRETPLSPIPKGRNGWLEGVRLAQQHKKEENMGPYRKFRSMRKSVVFITALATLAFIAGEARAMDMTPEQVKNVCGKKLVDDGKGNFGCTKACGKEGKQECDYGCTAGKGCTGQVIGRTGSPGFPSPGGTPPATQGQPPAGKAPIVPGQPPVKQ